VKTVNNLKRQAVQKIYKMVKRTRTRQAGECTGNPAIWQVETAGNGKIGGRTQKRRTIWRQGGQARGTAATAAERQAGRHPNAQPN